ncbi:MAG: hypothetical protein K0S04_1642 [Herbinix sp.]|jgi:hypothetical protein|nr:hypothetical protein [Herbinix sp.]
MRLAPIHMKYFTIALVMSIIFTANLVISPAVTIQEENKVVYTGISNHLIDVQLPLTHAERTYFMNTFSGNEMLSDVEVHLIVNRNLQSISNIILRINQILSPSIGFCVMLYCFGYVIRKKRRHKSILSRFLGGHAPPKTAFAV